MADESALRTALTEQFGQQEEARRAAEERGASTFQSAFKSGSAGLQGGMAQYGADLLESTFGETDTTKALHQIYKDKSRVAQGLAPEVHDYTQVLDDPSKALDYAAGIAGQNIPNLAFAAAGALAGRGALRGVISNITARTMAGSAAGAFLPEAGETAAGLQQDPVAAALPASERATIASGKGAVNAFLESLGAPASAVGRIARRGAATYGKEFLKELVQEAGTEGVQTLVEHAALGVANPARDTSHDINETINSMIAGGLLGGGISAAASSIDATQNFVANRLITPEQRVADLQEFLQPPVAAPAPTVAPVPGGPTEENPPPITEVPPGVDPDAYSMEDLETFVQGDAAAIKEPGEAPEVTAQRIEELDRQRPELIRRILNNPDIPESYKQEFERDQDVDALRAKVKGWEMVQRAKRGVASITKAIQDLIPPPKKGGPKLMRAAAPQMTELLHKWLKPEFVHDPETLRALDRIAAGIQDMFTAGDLATQGDIQLKDLRRLLHNDGLSELFRDPPRMMEEIINKGGFSDAGRALVASTQAERDVGNEGSVIRQMLTKGGRSMSTLFLRRMAREIDNYNINGPTSKKHEELFMLAMREAFGLNAEFVRDFYAQRHDSARGVYAPQEVLQTAEFEDATEAEFGTLTEQERKPQYRFGDPMRTLPYAKGKAKADLETTGQILGGEPEIVSMRQVVERAQGDPDRELRILLAKLLDRDIKNEALLAARDRARKIYDDTGNAWRALEEFEVIDAGEMTDSPFAATDADLTKMRTLKGKGGEGTKITFLRKPRPGEKVQEPKKFVLSAESMWKTWVAKNPGLQREDEDTPAWKRRMFMEALSAVLARDEILGTTQNEGGAFTVELPRGLLIERPTEANPQGVKMEEPVKMAGAPALELTSLEKGLKKQITELRIKIANNTYPMDSDKISGQQLQKTLEELGKLERSVTGVIAAAQRMQAQFQKTKGPEFVEWMNKQVEDAFKLTGQLELAHKRAVEANTGRGVMTTEDINPDNVGRPVSDKDAVKDELKKRGLDKPGAALPTGRKLLWFGRTAEAIEDPDTKRLLQLLNYRSEVLPDNTSMEDRVQDLKDTLDEHIKIEEEPGPDFDETRLADANRLRGLADVLDPFRLSYEPDLPQNPKFEDLRKFPKDTTKEVWARLAKGWSNMLGKYAKLYGSSDKAAAHFAWSTSTKQLIISGEFRNARMIQYVMPHEAMHSLVTVLASMNDPYWTEVLNAVHATAKRRRADIEKAVSKHRRNLDYLENEEELVADFFALWYNGEIDINPTKDSLTIQFFEKMGALVSYIINHIASIARPNNAKDDALTTEMIFRAFKSGQLASVIDQHLDNVDPLTALSNAAQYRSDRASLKYITILAAGDMKTYKNMERLVQELATLAISPNRTPAATQLMEDLRSAAMKKMAERGQVQLAPFMIPGSGWETAARRMMNVYSDRQRHEGGGGLITVPEMQELLDRMLEIQMEAARAYIADDFSTLMKLKKEAQQVSALMYGASADIREVTKDGGEAVGIAPDPFPFALDSERFSKMSWTRVDPITPEQQKEAVDEILRIRGPDIEVAFDDSNMFLGRYTREAGKRLIQINMWAADPRAVGWHESLHDFIEMLLTDGAANVRKALFDVAHHPMMKQRVLKLLDGHPAAQDQVRGSDEETLANMFMFWAGGHLRVTPEATNVFQKMAKFIRDMLGILSAEEKVEAVFAALLQGRLANVNTAALILAGKEFETLDERVARWAGPLKKVHDKVFVTALERLHNSGSDALVELADMFHQIPGREKALGMGLPFLQRRARESGKWLHGRFASIVQGKSAVHLKEAIRAMQTHTDPIDPAAKEVRDKTRALLQELWEYMSEAGVSDMRKGEDGRWEWEPLKHIKDYFPRMWSPEKIRNNRDKFVKALAKYVGAGEALMLYNVFTTRTGQIDLAETEKDLGFSPWMASVKERKLTFITRDNEHEFVEFMEDDLVHGMSVYINQAVHRAEYTRQFGRDGRKIQSKLEEAILEGMPAEQVAEMAKAVRALEGTLGQDMNPELRKTFSMMLVYENIALLPFALFSSLIDPLGVAVRTGELSEAWNSFKFGMKGIYEAFRGVEGLDPQTELARTMGIIDNRNLLESAGEMYSGMYMSQFLRKINTTFFKLNGMELWNRRMRVAALGAGMRFLMRHRGNERYMEELGLKGYTKEIEPRSNGEIVTEREDFEALGYSPEDAAAAEERIQNALFRFVDSTILRPTAAHRPVWASDPHWMLVFHLKQFTFSFNQVIMRRVQNEMAHGNNAAMWILASYVPFMIAADVARGGLTGLRGSWDALDWIQNGVMRSGVLGKYTWLGEALEDASRGSPPGTSFLGPTANHVFDLIQTLTGAATDSWDRLMFRSLPAGQAVRAITA